jgi:iron complex transport system substrate-binding protein
MKTFTPGAMALFALKTAGGINVATDAIASRGTNIGNYGKEKILSHALEIDVYLAQSGIMNHTSIKKIKEEPGFGLIKAVKNNQIYLIDEMIVSRPSFRLLKGVETIGSILYPNHYRKHPEEKETSHE